MKPKRVARPFNCKYRVRGGPLMQPFGPILFPVDFSPRCHAVVPLVKATAATLVLSSCFPRASWILANMGLWGTWRFKFPALDRAPQHARHLRIYTWHLLCHSHPWRQDACFAMRVLAVSPEAP